VAEDGGSSGCGDTELAGDTDIKQDPQLLRSTSALSTLFATHPRNYEDSELGSGPL